MSRSMGLFQVIVVIPLVDPHLAVVDLEDPVHQRAQEVAVMADQHDGAGEVPEGVQEDFPGLDVQVVGRLVQHQEIHRPGQEGCQDDPALLAAGEVLDPLVHRCPPGKGTRRSRLRITPMFARGMASCTVSKTVFFGSRISMACWLK